MGQGCLNVGPQQEDPAPMLFPVSHPVRVGNLRDGRTPKLTSAPHRRHPGLWGTCRTKASPSWDPAEGAETGSFWK